MNSRMDVEMPLFVYASYAKTDVVNNDFYFTIYWEETEQLKMGGILRPALEVKVGGFEKLLLDPSTPPAEREKQLKDAAQQLVKSLSGDKDWTKQYRYDDETGELSFVFDSMDEFPKGYFTKSFITDRFVCFKGSSFDAVLLHIQAWVYDAGGEGEKVCDCYRTLHVYYPPHITEFGITYAGEKKGKKAYVNPLIDNKITLSWKLQGNQGMNCRLYRDAKVVCEPVGDGSWEDMIEADTTALLYTLEMKNNFGICVSDQAEAVLTGWHKEGVVEGLPVQKSDTEMEVRVFRYGCGYYCYQDHGLYQSSDGLKWVLAPAGKESGMTEGDYTACGIQRDYFYVMTGKKGGFLQIARYHFSENKWEHDEVSQHCSSTEAHMAFSSRRGCLAETVLTGIAVMERDDGTDWRQWNTKLWEVVLEKGDAISSDFCFWKDEFYGVILCTDGMFHLYCCREEMEEELYVQRAAGEKIYLFPTVNRLLVLAGGCFYDVMERKKIKEEFMPDMRKGGWLGSAGQKVFGVFSDGCFWTWQI